jgi:hypothetical protein
MRDNLRSLNLIPLSQPYGSAEYSDIAYSGTETTTAAVLAVTGANAIVDWIIVELRDKTTPTTISFRQAALLQRDGDIVQTDGVTPIKFCLNIDNYYVAIRHRNHLGVMTASAIAFTAAGATVDFTLATTATYSRPTGPTSNPYPQKDMANVMAMWAGNGLKESGTPVVKSQSTNGDHNAIITAVVNDSANGTRSNTFSFIRYARTDLDMNGGTKMQGSVNDIDFLFSVLWNHTSNAAKSNTFFFYEQLP